MANWIVVTGPEIFETTRELGFARHAFKSTRSKMVQRIAPGDALIFYVTGKKQIRGRRAGDFSCGRGGHAHLAEQEEAGRDVTPSVSGRSRWSNWASGAG